MPPMPSFWSHYELLPSPFCVYEVCWMPSNDHMPKRRDEASKCANCKGNHISSYKGCPSFKEARSKLLHSRQMHQAKMINLQNHLKHMQQQQQTARRLQMPPPPATGEQPASSMHATASVAEANNRPTYSAVLRSPVPETAPLSPVPGRINKHQQTAQLNLQKKTFSKVMIPAINTQQPSEHRQHQQFQHRRQQADEQTQQQQSSNASPCEILLALRDLSISRRSLTKRKNYKRCRGASSMVANTRSSPRLDSAFTNWDINLVFADELPWLDLCASRFVLRATD